MAKASVNGITIGFDDVGEGENVLLLVHGHPFDRSMWRPQLAQAAGWDCRVIAPDLRGYGESSVVPGQSTLEVFADDLVALLDHLQVQEVVIGGLSMGGQIVMEFCRRYRDRVRGLVLAATFHQAETPEGRIHRNAAADRLLREGMASYAVEALPRMLGPHSIATLPAVAGRVLAMMRAAHPAGAAAALRGRAERRGYEDTLAGLELPCLIVVGDEDSFTTRADAEQMRSLVRGSELVWLERVGHMPNLEAADRFNLALSRFLSGLPAPQRGR